MVNSITMFQHFKWKTRMYPNGDQLIQAASWCLKYYLLYSVHSLLLKKFLDLVFTRNTQSAEQGNNFITVVSTYSNNFIAFNDFFLHNKLQIYFGSSMIRTLISLKIAHSLFCRLDLLRFTVALKQILCTLENVFFQ